MKKSVSSLLSTGVLLMALSFILLSGCKKQKAVETFNPAFTSKIIAFTSGVISSESTIRIILADDNPHAGDGLNTAASDDLFKFKPGIKGQAIWIDKRTLEFKPEGRLQSGEAYHCRFNLGKILDVEKDLSVFEFDFSVVEQDWAVLVNGYQTQQENDLTWNTIKGTVTTADNIDLESLSHYFTARQQGRKLKLKWEQGSDARIFSFTIDSVERKKEEEKVEISWDGSPEFPKVKGTLETIIPSLEDYKVLSINVIQQPEQYIEIIFSDPIKKNQDFDGLIYLENGTSLTYTVSGNIIKVFPVERQNGDAKITIAEGLVNILGYKLKASHVADITFTVPKPAVRLTGKGTILPSTRGMVFPFEAVNLDAVDVKIIKIFENNIGHFLQVNRLDGNYELKRAGKLVHKEKIKLDFTPANLGNWNRFYIDLAKLIQPDPGAIYRIEISFKKAYSRYPCEGETASEKDDEDSGTEESEDYFEPSYWDSYEDYYDDYYYYGDDYDWEQRDNPCSSSYYTNNRSIARNILASDLGIIYKAGTNNEAFCAITSLVTSKPLENVEVSLLNYQQQVVGSGTTGADGFVRISYKEKPYLLIAKNGKERGYLKVDDGSSLSLGAFDVSGRTVSGGIKAYLYGERGVWRPGDTLFLTCILEDKKNILPEKHPVIFELHNPKGQLYARTTKTDGVNGFYSWAVSTSQEVITGNYNLKVKIGGTSFNKTLKIESIKPNRLKLNLQFNVEKLSFNKPGATGNLEVRWLHGAIAAGLKTTVSLNLTPAPTVFSKYPNYIFTDPSKSFRWEEKEIYDGNLDDAGTASIPGRFNVDNTAPGMLTAHLTTKVFEKGGDFSIDRISISYSPYSAYVGLSTPQGDRRGMLLTDTSHIVEVLVLDENGNHISRSGLRATIYKLDWRNWWESFNEELANYVGNTYNRPVFTTTCNAVNGKGRFSFRIDRPEWGRFFVRVEDPVSGHSAGKVIFVDWPGWAGSPLKNNTAASMLYFNADKEKYAVGDIAEIVIPASGSGSALLCIENGSRILTSEWIPVSGKEIRHKFEVTPEMSPNVYVHVSLIQPHASSENDMPMRLYGVIPILVEDPQTQLFPLIKMPESLEPLQSYSIQVSEKNKREMTYTLAVVEEGLLDLTRYPTPDPWYEFYAREALGVRSWDLYDMVIGAFGGKLASVLGIGGDDDIIKDESAEKANRFKPVVKYLGPFVLKAGKTNSHKLLMPNYIGSVRVMVVAGQSGAYGNAEKAVPVKKPLMVLATLPRVLGPDESVKLPVTVFAMDEKIRQVSIAVKTNGLLVTQGEQTQQLSFDKPGEKTLDFDLKVSAKTGVAKVQVIATANKITAAYDIELNVRNANPPVTTFVGSTIDKGKTQAIDFELPGLPGTNNVSLEVSRIPPIDLGRRLKFLIAYPHGCIEQTTSAVFPQLYLSDILDLDEKFKATIDINIKAGLARLRTFQLSEGSFSYWPGQNYYNSWGSSYAGHFMLEAEKKGYALPAGMKKEWLKSQKKFARQWNQAQHNNHYDLEQAYRLYTLALAGEPEMSAMNRLRETRNISVQAKWRLAAAYALSGQKAVAKELITRETTEIQPYKGFSSTFGSTERDWAMLLETLVITEENLRAAELAKKVSEALSSKDWMSTQSTAYCLMAISRFAKIGAASDKINLTYTMEGKSTNVSSDKPVMQIELPVKGSAQSGSISLANKGTGVVFARLIMQGIPEAGHEAEFSNNLSMEVEYRSTTGDIIDVSALHQGQEFLAIVRLYNPGNMYYSNMALTQVFPPGWEITNNRLWDADNSFKKDVPTYQDIRDDRVMSYFDLPVNQSKTFVVQLTATYTGRYYLTGPYCEAMYDNSISAMKTGQWVEVIKR